MKTKIYSVISGVLLLAAPGTFALNTGIIVNDEPYVDDIPFSTVQIAESCRVQAAFYLNDGTLRMKEEAYVNDIPFDTKKIADSYLVVAKNRPVQTSLPEEAYINDIPFNTGSVAENVRNRMSEQEVKAEKDQRVIKIRIIKSDRKKDQYIIDLVSGEQHLRNYAGSGSDPAVVKVMLVN